MFYAFGYNQYNICEKASCQDCDSIHAEVDCVLKLKKVEKPKSINLCVFRTNNKGNALMMAKPCDNCIQAINYNLKKKNYVLKKLLYTDEEGKLIRHS